MTVNVETLINLTKKEQETVKAGEGIAYVTIKESDSINTKFTEIEECCDGTTCETGE